MSRVPRLLFPALACLFIAAAPVLAVGEPYLVRDLEVEISGAGSEPQFGWTLSTPVGERVSFFASDDHHGRQLWTTDGTPAGTRIVADLVTELWENRPGEVSESFRLVTTLEPRFLRLAETWITDGTAAGTWKLCEAPLGPDTCARLIGEIPGRRLAVVRIGDAVWTTDARSAPRRLGTLAELGQAGGGAGARLVESIIDPATGDFRLWTSDGTRQGTGWVGEGPDGPVVPGDLPRQSLSGGLYPFLGTSPSTGRELWITDGTAAGTRLLDDFTPGPESTRFPDGVLSFAADGGRIYFLAAPGNDTFAVTLHTSDGTPEGTVSLGLAAASFAVFGDRAVAFDSERGQVRITDGQPGDARLLAEVCPGSGCLSFTILGAGDERFFWLARHQNLDLQLWASDGTAAGTGPVRTVAPDVDVSFVGELNGAALFGRRPRGETTELVRLQGDDFLPLAEYQGFLGSLGDRLVFVGLDASRQPEPWVTDGTPGGTVQLGDLAMRFEPDPAPEALTALGDGLLFSWGDPFTRTRNLWRTDGTAAGTRVLTDLPTPPLGPGNGYPQEPGPTFGRAVEVDGWVVAVVDDPLDETTEIWVSDGTVPGTRRLVELPQIAGQRLQAGRRLAYFSGFGTPAQLIDPQAGTAFDRNGLSRALPTVLGGQEVFMGVEAFASGSLWRTNGTPDGTARVLDGWFDPGQPAALDGRIYFVARRSLDEETLWLWESDLTVAGTGPMLALTDGVAGATAHVVGGKLFVTAFLGQSQGNALWVSDGTAAGTEQIFEGAYLWGTATFGDLFAFVGQRAGEEKKLWISDGTVDGTRLLEGLRAAGTEGPNSEPSPRMLGIDGTLYFAANDLLHGVELWRTDGTPGGTRRLTDIAPGVFSSNPDELTVVDDLLYFTAFDNRRGRELWALPLDDDGGGSEEPPAPPAGAWITTDEIPGYRFKARITDQQGDRATATPEPGCIDETLCLSGRLAGRSEAFVRIVGPKPNGFFWPTLAKFTTSQVEVWIERLADGAGQYYLLPGTTADGPDNLPALFDRGGFAGSGVPASADGKGVRWTDATGPVGVAKNDGPPIPQGSTGIVSPEQPGFRFHVRLTSQTGEVLPHGEEIACIDETVCVSGSVPGRSELFLRVIGPRPNGMLWPTLVRFTTSRAEVWIEQLSTGAVQYYDLPAASPGDDRLDGLFDREGFVP